MSAPASRNYSGKKVYSGDLVAGSLLVLESRQVAQLLLDGGGKAEWDESILTENVLQKRSPASAKRQARLIRNRLKLLGPEAWERISSGSAEVATQFLLAAAIKQSRLLGDFMNQVVREHQRTFQKQLSYHDWDKFFRTCAQVEPALESWTETTVKKVRQVIFRILAEAGYIDDTRSRRLLPVAVLPEVKQYLLNHKEEYVLRCMEVNH